ncbi:sulfite exporter TauE/SafE [Fragilaria crotonensis]|nr:sulfite exporter TauE/SafE [Fragilaria crotonensis]
MRLLEVVFADDHEPLFPLTASDYVGFACATIGLLIATGGGIGGGGILVPIYILVMGFSPKHAIPLSNITVFGGAVANTVLNKSKRHPPGGSTFGRLGSRNDHGTGNHGGSSDWIIFEQGIGREVVLFKSPIGISCGSASFWIANFVMLAWIVIISLMARSYLVSRFELKRRLGYLYVVGDIQWSASATLVFPILCCFAGFFAGMFGIGGGIVKGPLMLAMGVHPAVVSATSATMILFTSSTSTTSYIVFGLLRMDYGIVCLCVGFLATYAGQICLAAVMKRFKRNSLIAFSIGFVVLASAVLMTVQSVLTLKKGVNHEPGGICSNEV